jgi:hypothetical protein
MENAGTAVLERIVQRDCLNKTSISASALIDYWRAKRNTLTMHEYFA